MSQLWGGIVAMLPKQSSLVPHACHESFVFHGVGADGLQLLPDLLDKSQILTPRTTSWILDQGPSIRSTCQEECRALDYAQQIFPPPSLSAAYVSDWLVERA